MADNVSMLYGGIMFLIITVIVVAFVYLSPVTITPLLKTSIAVAPTNPALDPGLNGVISGIQTWIYSLAIIIEVVAAYMCYKIATRRVTYNPGY
jgi:hypothetical protein